jgi:hypothetical protein
MVFVWVLVPVVTVVGLILFVSYRNRKPNSLEAGLRDFRRGLDALDPANDPLKRKADGRNGAAPDANRDRKPGKRR